MSTLIKSIPFLLALLPIAAAQATDNIIRVSAPVSNSAPTPEIPPSPSGFEHYRLVIVAVGGNDYARVVDMELIAENGIDLFDTYAVQASESSSYGIGFGAAQAIDNEPTVSTRWTSQSYYAANEWISFKFPSPVTAVTLTITNYPVLAGNSQQPTRFRLEGGQDGTNWTTIKEFSGVTSWGAGEKKTFDLK